MGPWMLSSAAAAFAVGILAWSWLPGWVEPWVALGAGLIALAAGWTAGAAARSGPGSLVEAGLLPSEHPAVEAIASGRVASRPRLLGMVAACLLGVLALGAGWSGLHHRGLETALLATVAPQGVEIEGILKTDPRPTASGWSATAQVRHVEWSDGEATLRSAVWVSGYERPPRARRGDLVRIEGRLSVPDDEFAEVLRQKGIPAQLQVDAFRRLGPSPSAFVRATQAVRAVVGRSIERVFPPREEGLLLGLLLGDDSRLDPTVERDFRASGLSHLLVVSGGNVAMVLAPVLAATTLLRLGRWPRFAVGTVAVVFFTILTGAEPSVLRAGVMACLALVAVLAGRPRSTGAILAAAVLGLLVLDPWLVWSVGFQLSVSATAGMVALASPLASKLGRLLPSPLATAAGATISAQLGVTPFLLYHFHEVPLATLPANLAAFPLVAPSLLLGAVAAGAGVVWFPLGKVLGAFAVLPMRWLELVADRLGKAPVGYLTSEGGSVVLVGGIALVAAIIVWIRSGRRPPRAAIAVAIAVLPLVVWASALTSGHPSGLTVRFFDVGQGDAALLTTPEGATVLVDGGPERERVATELSALGVKRLDLVVASHPHADHIVGLPSVLARFPVGLLLQPGCDDEPSPLQSDLDRAIVDEGIRVRNPRAGETFWVGTLRLDILSPDRCWTRTESNANNDSIVIRATYEAHVVLIATEPEEPAQEALLDAGVDLRADLLKVPHHGAATSLGDFFDAVSADVAIVSVGENDYGHPTAFTLDALVAAGSQVWRTDRHGTITVRFDGLTATIESERWL